MGKRHSTHEGKYVQTSYHRYEFDTFKVFKKSEIKLILLELNDVLQRRMYAYLCVYESERAVGIPMHVSLLGRL